MKIIYQSINGKLMKNKNTHAVPDGLCVDVYGSDPLQQELDHFQEGIAGLFGAAKLFSDVSLKR